MNQTPAERWARLKPLFDAAVLLPVEARKGWLLEACATDAEMRREVEELLRAYEAAGEFLETPALAGSDAWRTVLQAVDREKLQGRLIGQYRTLREIGRGGMGVVYLAARADGSFEKHVAIKVVTGALFDSRLETRFAEERRILATLDHPNIARLIDGGTTDEGMPYVVMEYVEGEHIDVYCRTREMPISTRLALFRQVCAAVQYSHQRLVVHRDLKAANILVTADGTPKLLDFGIAKLLEPADAEQTQTLVRALTPDGASPEQVRGEPVTVATDVYSLGVLLYRLLTDSAPYRTPLDNETNISRAICEEQPLAPSETLARSGAPGAAERLRDVRGDLDLIVLKALRKEPERRYASVAQLDDDIEHLLRGRPVAAAPDSRRYRAGKFVRRHRLGIAAAAAVLTAILAATGVSLYQTRVARRERAVAQQRFDMVRRLADAVVFDFNDALQGVPGATSARKLIVTRAIEYLDSLSQQEATDVALTRQLAAAYTRIGDIQGNPYVPNLGDTTGATASYQRAIALYEGIESRDRSTDTRAGLGFACWRLGSLYWSKGDADGARRYYSRALSIYDGLRPLTGQLRYDAASIVYALGQVDLRFGDAHSAAASYDRARTEYEAILSDNPADTQARRGLAVSYLKLGDAADRLGDDTKALGSYRHASEILDELLAAEPTSIELQRTAALTWLRYTQLRDLVPAAERERLARRAVAVTKPLADADPSNNQAALAWDEAQQVLAEALLDQGRVVDADDVLRSCLSAVDHLLTTNPGYVEARRILGFVWHLRGNVAMRRGAPRAALEAYQQARAVLESPEMSLDVLSTLAELYDGLGDAYSQLALRRLAAPPERDQAAVWYHRSQAKWTEVVAKQQLSSEETRERQEVERKLATHSSPRQSPSR